MKNMMYRIRNRKGFTLVELMIVVAIIGILAAIAIPAFLRAVKKSKTSEADGNIKKMMDGAKTYFTSEQKVTASVGGAEPWHTAGLGRPGYPVEWANYRFPGGPNYQLGTGTLAGNVANITLTVTAGNGSAANATVTPGSCDNAPTGGSKQLPFTGTEPTAPTTVAALNKLNVTFKDPTYFEYEYITAPGGGSSAGAGAAAVADFKVGGTCHHVYQAVFIDSATQEVNISPPQTSFEFE